MFKLIAHKNYSPKQLFRITGSSVYNSPGWSSVDSSKDLKTYLSALRPSLISIGELKDKSLRQTAELIKTLYDVTKQSYPSIIVISTNKEELQEIKAMFKT